MPNNRTTLAEGNYLGLYETDAWEYTERPNSTGVVAILPITADGFIVLVEQFRVPVQAKVIEIPAGLVGDEPGYSHEGLHDTALRELLEETGYRAASITPLLSTPTSAGMTTEMTHLFCAQHLTREHDGGGIDGEDIIVHHAALAGISEWLDKKQLDGYLIDSKIHACLCLAKQRGLLS